jgi:NADPH:quinone reductase-like Zn-dependent oxidoreductase
MKAIVLPDYNANIIRAIKSLEVRKRNIPQPGPEEVLIRVTAAPCNPSDIAFMRGGYNIHKPAPVTMGFECSGTVVDAGTSPEASKLLRKKVSCFSQGLEEGTWAEYFATDWRNCIVLDPEIDMLQAGGLCVNPFTAYALFQIATGRGCRTVLQNGASGQVGIFIRTLARREGIRVVNIVRKEEHKAHMEAEGEQWVLNSSAPDFQQKLAEIIPEKNACLGFDAVGGEMSGMMLNAMSEGSELIIYGGLSGKPACGINTLDIIFKGKSIRGFNLGEWKEEVGPDKFQEVADELQKLIMKGVLLTRIQGTFHLDEVQTAMEQYIRNMSSGKIMFTPGD